jgi:hypothetical protein
MLLSCVWLVAVAKFSYIPLLGKHEDLRNPDLPGQTEHTEQTIKGRRIPFETLTARIAGSAS